MLLRCVIHRQNRGPSHYANSKSNPKPNHNLLDLKEQMRSHSYSLYGCYVTYIIEFAGILTFSFKSSADKYSKFIGLNNFFTNSVAVK